MEILLMFEKKGVKKQAVKVQISYEFNLILNCNLHTT